MHALGVHHEHQRPDRDNYIMVEENKGEDASQTTNTIGVPITPYDPFSIM